MMPVYAGNGGVNSQAKNLPVGVNGVNRTVKEAWAGVNGVNRKVFERAINCTVIYEDIGWNEFNFYFYQNKLTLECWKNSYGKANGLGFNFSEKLMFTKIESTLTMNTNNGGRGYISFSVKDGTQNRQTNSQRIRTTGLKSWSFPTITNPTNKLILTLTGESDSDDEKDSCYIWSGQMIFYSMEYPTGIPFTFNTPSLQNEAVNFTVQLLPIN